MLLLRPLRVAEVRGTLRVGLQHGPREEGDVEAGVVVAIPHALAGAAAADPPHLDRTPFWGAGEAISVGSVLRVRPLAVEAALRGVSLVDVEQREAVAQEQAPEARGRSGRGAAQIISGAVTEGDDGALAGGPGLAAHALLEGAHEAVLALLPQAVGLEAVTPMRQTEVEGA